LVQLAVQEIGLEVDSPFLNEADTVKTSEGVEIVENGWERSNCDIELWRVAKMKLYRCAGHAVAVFLGNKRIEGE